MKNNLKIQDLPIETLTELAKEAFDECSGVFEMIVQNENRLAKFGEVLAACRAKIPRGKWSEWVKETFVGRLPLRTVQRWIAEAADPEKADAARQNDRKAKQASRSNAPDMAHSNPGVEVIEPGLKAEPRTNTKHTAENRKADPGKQPPTAPVSVQAELIETVRDEPEPADVLAQTDPAEILEACFRRNPVTAIVRYLINSTKDKDVGDVARQLRKAADLLDPPAKPAKAGTGPTAAELHRMIPSDWPEALSEAARQWATYKQGRSKGERIQSAEAWRIATKQIWERADGSGVELVVRKIEKAIANSWKGWDHGDDKEQARSGRTGRVKPSAAVPAIEYR